MATSQIKTNKKLLTCSTCGITNEDVIERTEYVGGQGYVTVITCRNEVECWQRWDEQHGIESDKGYDVSNCPIGLKTCYPSCEYWDDKCQHEEAQNVETT